MIWFAVCFLFYKIGRFTTLQDTFSFLLLSFCLSGTFLFCLTSYGRFIWLVQASSICIIYLDRIQDYQMIVFFSPSLSTLFLVLPVWYIQYSIRIVYYQALLCTTSWYHSITKDNITSPLPILSKIVAKTSEKSFSATRYSPCGSCCPFESVYMPSSGKDPYSIQGTPACSSHHFGPFVELEVCLDSWDMV